MGNIVLVSFIDLSVLFTKCISWAACAFGRVAGNRDLVDFSWETYALFISLFKSMFMSLLLFKLLPLYPVVFSIFKFKLLGRRFDTCQYQHQ